MQARWRCCCRVLVTLTAAAALAWWTALLCLGSGSRSKAALPQCKRRVRWIHCAESVDDLVRRKALGEKARAATDACCHQVINSSFGTTVPLDLSDAVLTPLDVTTHGRTLTEHECRRFMPRWQDSAQTMEADGLEQNLRRLSRWAFTLTPAPRMAIAVAAMSSKGMALKKAWIQTIA